MLFVQQPQLTFSQGLSVLKMNLQVWNRLDLICAIMKSDVLNVGKGQFVDKLNSDGPQHMWESLLTWRFTCAVHVVFVRVFPGITVCVLCVFLFLHVCLSVLYDLELSGFTRFSPYTNLQVVVQSHVASSKKMSYWHCAISYSLISLMLYCPGEVGKGELSCSGELFLPSHEFSVSNPKRQDR